ncbi:hypothetical protein [Flavobacterium sp. GT3R68]|uniref:hypothetical protein n=1 Tax=Flavobacterium sp. GT3R68 TaxID=2594437 RepID=UPI000F86CC7E|nr:hypothetical protein [Flavobacterium sp. GT3R68]RTY95243.1 hypothetical protein EKL32_07380 [Flavobacterium sp. GSN2]TRW91015.1 hypothetical protein FNW07_09290 [Flavobacterium sp. GT3R68]
MTSVLLYYILRIDTFYKNIESGVISIFDDGPNAAFIYNLLKYFAIPLLLLIITVFIISLLITRYLFEKNIIPKETLEIKIDTFLTEIIFSDYSIPLIKLKIKSFIDEEQIPFEKKWCRESILSKIITVKQNINSVNPHQLLLVYKYFGFEFYSKKLILSRKWHRKSKGIYHYQMLDYKIKKGYIKPYINDKNRFLKSNALIALISLSDEKFDILNNYQDKLSKADELKILDIIYQKKSTIPKRIGHWLTNENTSIVILAVKLMIQYRETLTIPQICSLLANQDLLVRKETILAIRELVTVEANDCLMAHYPHETDKRNRISILKTFGIIGNMQTNRFVSGLLSEEEDLEIKFEIIHCLLKIDRTYFEGYSVEDQTEGDIINRIVLHVNNPYLI